MSRSKKCVFLTAGAAAGLFLAVLAPDPVAAADSTAPPNSDQPIAEQSAEQPSPQPAEQPTPAQRLSLPETLKTTASYMSGIPATPALLLQGTASLMTGLAATPAQILQGTASALVAAGIH